MESCLAHTIAVVSQYYQEVDINVHELNQHPTRYRDVEQTTCQNYTKLEKTDRLEQRSIGEIFNRWRNNNSSTKKIDEISLRISFIDKSFGFTVFIDFIKVNKSRYIALLLFSGYIKKPFSIDCVNIYLFSMLFSIDFARWKSMGLLHIAYIVIYSLS